MDAFTDPTIEEIVFMASAQVGKTEALLNALGYFIDQDPSPILFVMPTIEMGEGLAKERIDPMIRDTKCLTAKVSDARDNRRGPTSTIRNKAFPGGRLNIAGANKPASLSSRPCRVVMGDELDRYPISAGVEGDPFELAKKRTTTFWNRKHLATSTPTVRGLSKIEQMYDASDKRRYHMPCPHCEEFQVLEFENLTWEGKGSEDPAAHKPETVVYACAKCGAALTDQDKPKMLERGQWIAERPGGKVAGFHIWEGYSPWVRWSTIVRDYLEKRKHPETMKTFVNTSLGRTWEVDSDSLEWEVIASRAEEYAAQAPAGVAVITAGLDVQADRVECEVVGWGRNEESWSLEYRRFFGDTSKQEIWDQVAIFLADTTYKHELGLELKIATAFVDTGYRTRDVYRFLKGKERQRSWEVMRKASAVSAARP
jgi:phage terminase large subunit GpA-like protein